VGQFPLQYFINYNLKKGWYITWQPTLTEAKNDRDCGDPTQFTIGPSLQFYRKPLIKLKNVTTFDPDDTKSRFLVLETGYRYITAPDAAPENRMVTAVTFNYPVGAGIRISDRNRADLDWKNGSFTWRYRNKLDLARTFAIHSYHIIPYVTAEPYYESQYGKWSTTSLFAGCLFPVGKHVEFNATTSMATTLTSTRTSK
jgi:hypothetical protein